jgi:Fic family protein
VRNIGIFNVVPQKFFNFFIFTGKKGRENLFNTAKLPPSPKKIESAKKASEIKANKAKEKVINAVNLLRLQGEEITPYKVAKTAGISYNTAKKYLNQKNISKLSD